METISVENVHPTIKVKKRAIRLLIENILKSEKVDSGLDVIFVGDRFMRKLNRTFTGRDQTTDVLSFGMSENKSGATIYPNLGDVYISLDQAKRQASDYGAKLDEEIRLLVAHGLLHLLGYDHAGKKEERIMKKKEQTYLKKTGS
ncbi:MAG: rRNA maturation RNase YbeY [Candidatus Zixiibacteriota bacterium]